MPAALPILRRVAFVLVLIGPVATQAFAAPTFSFDSTPGKLPKSVVPHHYAIELVPDLTQLTVAGNEIVDVELREPTARLTLNAANMAIAEAVVDNGAQQAEIALDAGAETATLAFSKPLAVGLHKLRLTFTSHVNSFPRGLFYVDYPAGQGSSKRMISSQLEPSDARRIFPCWDEPAFKATFALTVTVPRAFMAVGNMPSEREDAGGPDLKRVTFATTPRMSSYLFVLAAGELERQTVQAAGVTVGVVTTRGNTEKGRFALETAAKLLAYYNDYFGTKYPLPKLDLIAVPGGFGGAMENWGGITFFESRLLFDPASNPETARRGIFAILAHEMAHQWFGDLVTMGWWDNLWLNEGFASWMQEKAAEHFHPEWKTWLNGYGQKQFALTLDARRTSHPIQQKVADQSEAQTAFDGITYNKGQAFIRMLESYLGETTFRDGIRSYMASHAYRNTTTADLWKALEAVARKPVGKIAASFTEQEGVPLIVAETNCIGGKQQLVLRQERFAVVPASAGGADSLPPRRWQVPVAIAKAGAAKPSQMLLLDGSAEIATGPCDEAIKVNFGDIGYYRVAYGPANGALIAKALPAMSSEDRVNVLADDWAMVRAAHAEPASYFALLGELDAGDDRAVWDQVISAFSALDRLALDRPERPAVQAYARAILRPVLDRLGWDGKAAGEDDEATLLRTSLINLLGEFGDADVIAEAKRRFASFLQDPASLAPALRDPVTHVAGLAADRDTYEALLGLARRTTATNERLRYYYAAAAARDPALARETLALTLTGEPPITIVDGMINTVAWAGEQPDLAWDFIQKNLDALVAKQGPDFKDLFIPNFMTNFSDAAHADELAHFMPAQATSGGRVMTARALETIAISVDVRTRALPAIAAWIADHPAKRP
jgi:aminopeptidase N